MQHVLKEELKEKIDEAIPLLEKQESVERAKELLKKGSEMIAERQKLIKIADRSEQGWKTAQEYERDPVASDSDDEKRIRISDYSYRIKETTNMHSLQLLCQGVPFRTHTRTNGRGYQFAKVWGRGYRHS